jgi:hypothetical protein
VKTLNPTNSPLFTSDFGNEWGCAWYGYGRLCDFLQTSVAENLPSRIPYSIDFKAHSIIQYVAFFDSEFLQWFIVHVDFALGALLIAMWAVLSTFRLHHYI